MHEHNFPFRQETLYQTIGDVLTIKDHNNKLNNQLISFVGLLNDNSIPYIVVKGQVAAQWYYYPLLRQPGDIDIYVPHKHFDLALQCVKDNFKVELLMDVFEKHAIFSINGSVIELHKNLVQFTNRENKAIWENYLNSDECGYVLLNGKQVRTLSPTLNILYVFIHLFHHLIQSGIGLKQVCDLMMCLHYYQHVIDKQKLDKILSELGLKKAFLSIGAIMIDKLGLSENKFHFSIENDHHKMGEKILKDMLKTGNFGKNVDIIHQTGRLHSIQTGFKIMLQSCKYISLAPNEISIRLPQLFIYYLKKKWKFKI